MAFGWPTPIQIGSGLPRGCRSLVRSCLGFLQHLRSRLQECQKRLFCHHCILLRLHRRHIVALTMFHYQG